MASDNPGSISKPSFESVWYNIQAQNNSFPYLKIQHDLGEYPVKVDVQIKIRLNGTNFIFTGFGSAHRDDDFNEPYGGVVYIYNTQEVILTFPIRYNNFALGGVAFTGKKHQTVLVTLSIAHFVVLKISSGGCKKKIINDANSYFDTPDVCFVYIFQSLSNQIVIEV